MYAASSFGESLVQHWNDKRQAANRGPIVGMFNMQRAGHRLALLACHLLGVTLDLTQYGAAPDPPAVSPPLGKQHHTAYAPA